MNRRERRAARARRPSPVELERARRALTAAFADPELAVAYERNAPDVLDEAAELVAGGFTTVERAASMLARINDLSDATLRGDISVDEGCVVIAQATLAERRGQEPD